MNDANCTIKSFHTPAVSPHLVVEGDGSRAVQVLPDQNFPHGSVQVGDLNAVGPRVRPVDLPADSVHCQAISCHQAYRETQRDAEVESGHCDCLQVNMMMHVKSSSSPVDMMSS